MKYKILTTLIAFATVTLAQAQFFTYHTLAADTENRGTFTLYSNHLNSPSQLSSSGSNPFYYAYALFTPTISGTYAFGIKDASYDPVMIVYADQLAFPADPSTNVIGLNDDWDDYAFNGLELTNSNNPWDFNINPVVNGLQLMAHSTYLVAVTSFDAGTQIPLPISFFAYGPATVDVGGPAIPEPSTYAAIFGAVALGGAAFWRRRQKA